MVALLLAGAVHTRPTPPSVCVVATTDVGIAGTSLTVNVKLCVAVKGWAVLVAVIVNGYDPAVPAPGVPARVAVPSLLSVKVTPLGSVAPPSDKDAVGSAVVVTENVPAWPTVKVT
jgi:hypothetical protein